MNRYTWKSDDETADVKELIQLTNPSPLTLNCTAKVAPPFDVVPKSFSLDPQDSMLLTLSLNAAFNGKHSSTLRYIDEYLLNE